jgi:hypothetical protein
MVPEMLATIVRIARSMVANGETGEAVELLAMIEAEPDSAGQLFTEGESVEATAFAALAELEPAFDEAEFAELRTTGAQLRYRSVVKQLVEAVGSPQDPV